MAGDMILQLAKQWSFDPSVLTGLAVLCAVYWLCTRGPLGEPGVSRPDRRFVLLLVLAFLALESPLDYVSDRYLFSAHMLQHMILLLGVAPLLAVTLPEPLARRVPRWLLHPVTAFLLFSVDTWLWHAPALYDATLLSEPVHVTEHLTFVLAGYLFWRVALRSELPALVRILYVFLGGVPETLLGAILTFSPPLYSVYRYALEQPGMGRALQVQFGLTPATDQELGGLLMWVAGGLVFLIVIVGLFVSWSASAQMEQPASKLGPAALEQT